VLLDKLELFGFKSFAHRTHLRFSPGITAVVGPNGCGKSNISDAIRWALGEQNVRNLRGKQLDDVIFKGTREAKPMGMAEVAPHLDNREQCLATEYSHVAIQRRAFRSGESQFLINKSPCRLRDIRDLFMDTGLGSSEYAVIEREMIDEVLADRDSARRFLLDEASGITRYKQRRRETLRKIEAVEGDLVRVEDALEIEEREVRSLAYQMGKARRYRRLTERIRDLDLALARLRWDELAAAEQGESGKLTVEGRQRETWRTETHQLEAQQEQVRLELLDLDRRIAVARERLTEAEGRLSAAHEEALVLEERLRHLEDGIVDRRQRIGARAAAREKAQQQCQTLLPQEEEIAAALAERRSEAAEAQRVWQKITGELQAAKEHLAQLQQVQIEIVRRSSASDQRFESLESRLAELTRAEAGFAGQIDSFAGRAAALEGELDRLRSRHAELAGQEQRGAEERERLAELARDHEEQLTEVARRLARREEEAARLESRHHLLDEQAASFEGYQEGVARLLASADSLPGICGVLSEQVTIASAWRERLSPVLRGFTEWVIVETEDVAWQAVAWLHEQGLGQVTFFPLDGIPAVQTEGGLPADALTAPHARLSPLIEYLRGTIVPVADRAALPPLGERRQGLLWVTERGEVCAASGWLSAGGRTGREVHLWQRRPEIAALEEQLAVVAQSCRELGEQREQIGAARAESLERIATMQRETDERRATLENLGRTLADREAEARLIDHERARLKEEHERTSRQREALQAELAGSRQDREQSAQQTSSTAEQLTDAAERVEQLTSEKERLGTLLTERRMKELAVEARRRDLQTASEQLAERIHSASAEIETMEAERTRAQADVAAGKQRLAELDREQVDLLRRKEGRREDVDRLAQERTRFENRLSELEGDLRQRRRKLSEVEDALRENEVRLARIDAEKERLRERIGEHYGLDPAALEEQALLMGSDRAAPPPAVTADQDDDAEAQKAPEIPSAWTTPRETLGERTPEIAREELTRLRRDRDRLGPVNVLAIEEHERKREHVHFIRAQRDDLVQSKESLLAAIDRINTEARRLFSETFGQVHENFGRTFTTLFPGGEARIRLSGDDPLDADIEIMARPRGKRLETIRLLSSGERALTATALLFAVYLVKPSPFCVLDEVDAPLDDANIERFVTLLRAFCDRTQFIVITHNKLTMEIADTLYGVTMQEPGISKIVSVRLEAGRLVSEDGKVTSALAGVAGTS